MDNKLNSRIKNIPVVAVLHTCDCGTYYVEPVNEGQFCRALLSMQCLYKGCLNPMKSEFVTLPELNAFKSSLNSRKHG